MNRFAKRLILFLFGLICSIALFSIPRHHEVLQEFAKRYEFPFKLQEQGVFKIEKRQNCWYVRSEHSIDGRKQHIHEKFWDKEYLPISYFKDNWDPNNQNFLCAFYYQKHASDYFDFLPSYGFSGFYDDVISFYRAKKLSKEEQYALSIAYGLKAHAEFEKIFQEETLLSKDKLFEVGINYLRMEEELLVKVNKKNRYAKIVLPLDLSIERMRIFNRFNYIEEQDKANLLLKAVEFSEMNKFFGLEIMLELDSNAVLITQTATQTFVCQYLAETMAEYAGVLVFPDHRLEEVQVLGAFLTESGVFEEVGVESCMEVYNYSTAFGYAVRDSTNQLKRFPIEKNIKTYLDQSKVRNWNTLIVAPEINIEVGGVVDKELFPSGWEIPVVFSLHVWSILIAERPVHLLCKESHLSNSLLHCLLRFDSLNGTTIKMNAEIFKDVARTDRIFNLHKRLQRESYFRYARERRPYAFLNGSRKIKALFESLDVFVRIHSFEKLPFATTIIIAERYQFEADVMAQNGNVKALNKLMVHYYDLMEKRHFPAIKFHPIERKKDQTPTDLFVESTYSYKYSEFEGDIFTSSQSFNSGFGHIMSHHSKFNIGKLIFSGFNLENTLEWSKPNEKEMERLNNYFGNE